MKPRVQELRDMYVKNPGALLRSLELTKKIIAEMKKERSK